MSSVAVPLPGRMVTAWIRGAAGLIGVSVAAWALVGPLAHALPMPEISSAGAWRTWLDHVDPITAAATLIRVASLVACGALAAGIIVTMIGVAGRRARRTPRLIRMIPAPVIGFAALIVGATACGTTPSSTSTGPVTRIAPIATITRLAPAPPRAPAPVPAPAPPSPPSHVTVREGQNLWSIAVETVAAHGWDGADLHVVGRYWVALMHANPQLRDPSLVYPGQVLELPRFES